MGTKERDRERRLKATGKWFKRTETKTLWVNHIFPILLVIALINYLIWK